MNEYIRQYVKHKYNNDEIDQKLNEYRRIKKYPKNVQSKFKSILSAIEALVESYVKDNPKNLPKRMATFNAFGNIIINDSRQFSSESVIQHELYSKLKHNFRVIPELKVEDCIFDLAIIDVNSRLLCIVEVKRTNQLVQRFLKSEQFQRYSRFSIPIYSTADASDKTIEEIKQLVLQITSS